MTAALPPDANGEQAAPLAFALALEPDAVRAVATRTALIAEMLPWRSPAATAYRARVTATACALRAAADELDAAVELLQRYAFAVRDPAGGR